MHKCKHHVSTTVDCSNNNISEVPVGIPTDTTTLILWGNRIRTIHLRAFVNRTSLRMLDLSRNRLRTIHENAFAGLTHLETLNLGENELQTIHPGVFRDLLFLKNLELHYNPFDDFGTYPNGALKKLVSLNFLLISVWSGLSFSESLEEMISLKTLHIHTYHWFGTVIHNNTLVGFKTTDIKYLML